MTGVQKNKIPLKSEELIMGATFLRNSLVRDIADFAAISTIFNNDYLESYNAKIEVVDKLVRNDKLRKDLKAIKLRIYENIDALRTYLNKTENYLNLAHHNLTMPPVDFEISEIRKAIAVKNTEAVLFKCETMMQKIADNTTTLAAKGMNAQFITDMTNHIELIQSDTELYVQKNSSKSHIIIENHSKMEELWNTMNEIMKSGKAIYKSTDPVKVKDYTLAQIKKQMHRDSGEEDQIVSDEKPKSNNE